MTDAIVAPIVLQAITTPINVNDIPFVRANNGKNGSIMDLDRHCRNPQNVKNPNIKCLFITHITEFHVAS